MSKGVDLRKKGQSLELLYLSEFHNHFSDRTSRLSDISYKFHDKNAGKSLKSNPATVGRETKLEEILRPYRLIEKRKASKFVNRGKSAIRSKRLEALFQIEARENEAAKVIQKFWRRTQILLPWRHAVKCVLLVTQIQRRVRGYLTRKAIAKWYRLRVIVATDWQAMVRKVLQNKRTKIQLQLEAKSAICIQRIFRGFLCRYYQKVTKRNAASVLIQRVWRGVVGRCLADKVWLNKIVVVIQACARRMLARHQVRRQAKDLRHAALAIQSKYRQWKAFKYVGSLFFEREVQYREESITRHGAGINWAEDELVRLAKRLNKAKIVAKVNTLLNEMYASFEDIHHQQRNLVDLKRQAETLSPRSLQMGYAQSLTEDIKNGRAKLTQDKLRTLFIHARDLGRLDSVLDSKVEDIGSVVENRDRLNRWKEAELRELHDMVIMHRTAGKAKALRVSIADERRKWKVLFYTRDGKPDKRRPPGKKWAADVFAGAEKATYCGGHDIDLLANLRQRGGEQTRGTTHSVDATTAEYGLQIYIDQVNQYERLLDPITSIMKDFMNGARGHTGFGQEGLKAGAALESLDQSSREFGEESGLRTGSMLEDASSRHPLLARMHKKQSFSPVVEMFSATPSVLSDMSYSFVSSDRYDSDYSAEDDEFRPSHPHTPPRPSSQVSRDFNSSFNAMTVTTAQTFSVRSFSSESTRGIASPSWKRNPRPTKKSVIPWTLLDNLDADKRKFDKFKELTKTDFRFL